MHIYLGLRFRLALIMGALIIATVGVLYALNRRAENQIRYQIEEQIAELTTAVEIGLQSISDADYLEDIRARRLPVDYDNRIKHILIVNSKGLITDAANGIERGQQIELPQQGNSLVVTGDPFEKSSLNSINITKENKRTVYVPFRAVGSDGRPEINYVVVVMSSSRFEEVLSKTSTNRLIGTITILGLGLAVSITLMWRFTKPLSQLAQAAKRIAKGDLDFHINLKRNDEIGQLATNFDQMIDQLIEKQKLEERLNQSERSAVIGRLASGIAHEIRNPLNFINLTIDHLRTKFSPIEVDTKKIFDRLLISIKEEIARLNSLVNNVLRFGKPARLSLRSTSLAAIVENIFQLVALQADEQNVKLKLTDHTNRQEIKIDIELMNSCFTNLITNALQAMTSGGDLYIEIYNQEEEQFATFTDTGIGIPKNSLDQVFEPYYSTKETGIGLGLAVTRKLIEEHSGHISVASIQGQGTTFTVRLPKRCTLS